MILLWSLPALAGPRTAMIGFSGDPAEATRAVEIHGGQIDRCFQRARFCTARFPGTGPLPLDGMAQQPGVRYAEADRLIPPADIQGSFPDANGTTDCADQWELDAIRAPEAWGIVDGSGAPVVAIADGGFLQGHEDLAGRYTGQYDYGDGDSNANLEWSVGVPAHGTFIGGMVAAKSSNGVGRAGVAPNGKLNLLKIADQYGSFYFSYAASAIADVADGDLGIRAVNYSIASSSYTQSFYDAVASLGPLDILLVAAAGNCSTAGCSDADNDANPLYPASFSFDHVVTVAGSTRDGGHNSYSHYGRSSVDLAAPGVDLCSLGVSSTDSYYTSAGTSYATPIVAAAVALLIEAHPDLTALEVARVLRASAAEHTDWQSRVRSGGVLDLYAALQTSVPRLSPPDDVTIDQIGLSEIQVYNAGAEGTGHLLLFHDRFSVRDAGDWTVTPFSAGDTVALPDAGSHTATAAGTLLSGPLAAHQSTTVSVVLGGTQKGTETVSARLVTTSAEGADYLSAPYDTGDADETGFLALSFEATVTALAPEDTEPEDTGSPDDTAAPDDTATPDDTAAPDDETPSTNTPKDDTPAGCTHQRGPLGGWVLAALVGLSLRRRRTR